MAGRNWETRLREAWLNWSGQLAQARAGEHDALNTLVFPGPERWIEHPRSWVCLDRGLGDYARFALVRSLGTDEELGIDKWRGELDATLPLLQNDPKYIDYKKFAEIQQIFYTTFNRQQYLGGNQLDATSGKSRKREFPADAAVKYLSCLMHDDGWDLIAYTINRLTRGTVHDGCTSEQLRYRRFDGKNAVTDFLTYLKTGRVAPRQASRADLLRELHVESGHASFGVAPITVPDDLVKELCDARLASPSAFRHLCLWNRSHPSCLVPAALQLIERYDQETDAENIRRLPAIYVPLRARGKDLSMSRRRIVRALYEEICIRRKHSAGLQPPDPPQTRRDDPELAEAAGVQLESEVRQIRDQLARVPMLIIFYVHHVNDSADETLIEEHTLDSPLPYALSLLMPETGDLKKPFRPKDVYATRVLILANGPIDSIASQQVKSWHLPITVDHAALSHVTPSHQSQDLMSFAKIAAAAAGEMELSLLKAAMHLREVSDEGNATALVGQLAKAVSRGDGMPCQLKDLVNIFVDHVLEQARASVSGAWFATILQLATLVRGGIREDTLARVLAGYVVCTSEPAGGKRRDWAMRSETALWTPAFKEERPSRLDESLIGELQKLIRHSIEKFKKQATVLLRLLQISHLAGLDDSEQYFESPEVPELRFVTEGTGNLIDFEWPRIQLAMQSRFRRALEEKHTLLRLLLADECARRAAIIQRHSMAPEPLSLLQKRYVISAINHGLDGLSHDRTSLLSSSGSRLWRWGMPGGGPRDIYLWIYEELYTGQLNGNRHLLSKEHGAEKLKRALILKFLDTWKRLPAEREESAAALPDLKMIFCVTELLEGLVHVGIRTIDMDLQRRSQQQRDELIERAETAIAAQSPDVRESWAGTLQHAARRTLKLKLDGEVIYELAASKGSEARPAETPAGSFARMRASLLDALSSYVDTLVVTTGLERGSPPHAELSQCLFEMLRSADGLSPAQPRARLLLKLTPRGQVQFLYDCLVRFAQILAVAAEDNPKKLRQHALCLFDLADSLRQQANDAPHLSERVEISPRPMRYAARLCLTLGETSSDSRNQYFERSSYYAHNLAAAMSQYHIERIASLIIHASTIRIRGAASGTSQLDSAMKTLKLAEQALIHYPDRSQLWARFYLERAKIFRDRALSSTGTEQKQLFKAFCEHDIAAVRRLAPPGTRWHHRADGVFNNLKAGRRTLEAWRKSG